jgi:hypothetical protein
MNTLCEKFNLQHSTNLKYVRRMLGNPINNCDFLKFIIFVRGGQSYYVPQEPEDLITTLDV